MSGLEKIEMSIRFNDLSLPLKELEAKLKELRAIPLSLRGEGWEFLEVFFKGREADIYPDKNIAEYVSTQNFEGYNLTYSRDYLMIKPKGSLNEYYFHTEPKSK